MDCPQTYCERLDTFDEYPWDCAISREDMARAGFYINPRAPQKTRCFTCKVNFDNWNDDDDPVVEHLRISPGCPWIRVLGDKEHTVRDRFDTFEGWPYSSDSALSALKMAEAGFFYNPRYRGDDTAECAFCQICFHEWNLDDAPLEVHQSQRSDCAYIAQMSRQLHELPVPVLAPPADLASSLFGLSEKEEYSGLVQQLEPVMELSGEQESSEQEIEASEQVSEQTQEASELEQEASEHDQESSEQEIEAYTPTTDPKFHLDEELTDLSIRPALPEESVGLALAESPMHQDTTFVTADDSSEASHSASASMVTVDAEEVSVDSSHLSNNENDPETPKDTSDTPSLAPPLSILRNTYTSTPFERASPNRLLSHPMPSPLPDLGRQSFELSHSRMSPVMYPRLPSFFKEPSSPTPSKMEYSYDNSTPSPQRNAFNLLHESQNQSEGSSLASLPSFEQQPVRIQVPTMQELASEFEDYLPPSSLEFLYSVKDQTVAEWQALLADEVCKQIRKITAQAVERLEVERKRVIAQVRAQYSK